MLQAFAAAAKVRRFAVLVRLGLPCHCAVPRPSEPMHQLIVHLCVREVGRNPKPPFNRCEQCAIGPLQRSASRHDRRCAPFCHEGRQRELEAFLTPVGPDRPRRIGGPQERCDTFCPNTVSPGLVSKGPLPSAETCRAGTALRSVRTATTRHRCRQKSDELPFPHSA
jgi:hypothetical protein